MTWANGSLASGGRRLVSELGQQRPGPLGFLAFEGPHELKRRWRLLVAEGDAATDAVRRAVDATHDGESSASGECPRGAAVTLPRLSYPDPSCLVAETGSRMLTDAEAEEIRRRIGRAACYSSRCSVTRTRLGAVATGHARR